MKRAFWLLSACALTLTVACSKPSTAPTAQNAAPNAAVVTTADANADGSTLKATTPTPQSPINGVRLPFSDAPLLLTTGNATTTFATGVPLAYRFELTTAAGAVVETALVASGAGSSTSYTITTRLEGEATYQWRVRPEYSGTAGPWSARATFIAPQTDGYIKGSELYDPLTRSKTVGTPRGPITFIPGQGARLDSFRSYIAYTLPVTLREGEFSALVSNLQNISPNEDPKWRVLTMREGETSINDNIYRMSVDKRGNGAVAWRFLTNCHNYIETVGAEREVQQFHEALTYFYRAIWRDGVFRVTVKEGGANGVTMYDVSKPYDCPYQPLPHNVYAGSPFEPGDRGDASSVEDMIIRQIWVSANPRPAFADQ